MQLTIIRFLMDVCQVEIMLCGLVMSVRLQTLCIQVKINHVKMNLVKIFFASGKKLMKFSLITLKCTFICTAQKEEHFGWQKIVSISEILKVPTRYSNKQTSVWWFQPQRTKFQFFLKPYLNVIYIIFRKIVEGYIYLKCLKPETQSCDRSRLQKN